MQLQREHETFTAYDVVVGRWRPECLKCGVLGPDQATEADALKIVIEHHEHVGDIGGIVDA